MLSQRLLIVYMTSRILTIYTSNNGKKQEIDPRGRRRTRSGPVLLARLSLLPDREPGGDQHAIKGAAFE